MIKARPTELTYRDKKEPYRVTTPAELWFVPDLMYIVDSKFSRDDNVVSLETDFDVVTEPELSDEYHLVWKNYHSLSEQRIESFLKLKPCGLYLLIDTLKWERPTNEYEYSYFNKHFNKLANDHIDKIAQLIQDYPEHFKQKNLKSLSFSLKIFHNDNFQAEAATKLGKRLHKFYEIYSDQKNLDWKFDFVGYQQIRPITKFCIEIHMNTNSYFMGIKLLSWEDSYPYNQDTVRYGSPICDIVKLLDIKPRMIVMDLNVGFAENVLELASYPKCHTIGVLENKIQQEMIVKKCKRAESSIAIGNVSFITCEEFETVPNVFNTRVLDRVIICATNELNECQVQSLVFRLEKCLICCPTGCVALITLPLNDYSEECIKNVFDRSPYFNVIMNVAHVELYKQYRIYKIIRKTPEM